MASGIELPSNARRIGSRLKWTGPVLLLAASRGVHAGTFFVQELLTDPLHRLHTPAFPGSQVSLTDITEQNPAQAKLTYMPNHGFDAKQHPPSPIIPLPNTIPMQTGCWHIVGPDPHPLNCSDPGNVIREVAGSKDIYIESNIVVHRPPQPGPFPFALFARSLCFQIVILFHGFFRLTLSEWNGCGAASSVSFEFKLSGVPGIRPPDSCTVVLDCFQSIRPQINAYVSI